MEDKISESDVRKKLSSGEFISVSRSDRKSDVWVNFDIINEKSTGKRQDYVQCRKCKKLLSYKGSKGGTSHLSRHKCTPTTNLKSVFSFLKPKEPNIKPHTKEELINSCVQFCAKDLRSFETVSGEGFLDLATTLIKIGASYGQINAKDIVPHPSTISRHVSEAAVKLHQQIFPEIKEAMSKSNCAVTTDMWTDDYKKRAYTSVTVHYIKDWQLVNRVLFTCDFPPERKTGLNIKREITKRFEKLGFESDLLNNLIFVTDQGANIVKALENYTRFNCSAHVLNTVLRHTFDSEFLQQNAVEFFDILTKTKSLVTYLKQSGLVSKLDKTVHQEVETRWNSKLSMLMSVIEQYEKIENILEDHNMGYHINGISKMAMEELTSFLRPFKEASDTLESEKYPTFPFVILYYYKIMKHLNAIPGEPLYLEKIKERAIEYMQLKYKFSISQKIATFLWPKFRQLRMLSIAEKEEVIVEIRKQIEVQEASLIESRDIEEDSQLPNSDSKKLKLSNEFLDWEDIHNTEVPKDEVEKYINCEFHCDDLPTNLLEWWKQHECDFPKLSKVAKKYLNIPGSSASSERNFSTAGNVIHYKRTRLNPETVDNLLFLHSNL